MHNNIMAAGSKDRPPMLGPGRYSQWRSHFLRYIDTKPNDDIYSTVDACKTANEMWIAIERLQQGESLNVQDVKTNLFWEFGKCVLSREKENQWSRITHDSYYQAPKPQRTNTTSSSTRPNASTRHKEKEIAKPVTPQSESVSEEDIDPEQAQRDKDMQKNLALLAKYFKKLYKPTNNNLQTSSNSRNKTEDTTPRYNNDNQSGQFGNQRTMTVAGARETVGSHQKTTSALEALWKTLFNVKGWLDEDLDNYHLKELRCSTQCHTQMSMWIISRGVVLLILLMLGISFKFDISGLLHHVITTIAYRIRDKDTSQSKQNLQSSSMTFIHKTLIIPSVLDSCFISSTVSEVKRGEVVYTTSLRMVVKYSTNMRRTDVDFSACTRTNIHQALMTRSSGPIGVV
ncbi:hypothetical protein Tco_0117719 [Tanacetum coccineum]